MMIFEWDSKKAATNKSKHEVSFEEATTVFGDPLSLTIFDPMRSKDESRYVTVGNSNNNRILVVTHTEKNNILRIISARDATRREIKDYAS